MEKFNYSRLLLTINFVFLLGVLTTSSCKKQTSESSSEISFDNAVRLRPSNLYHVDSIAQFIATNGTTNQDKALQLYERFKLLRETDKAEAAWTLKMGLTLFPEASWYADLGDVLIEANMFNEAQMAYKVFLKSEVKPTKQQALNMLKATILADENDSRYDMSERAKNFGANQEELMQLMADYEIQKRLTPQEIQNFKDYLTSGPGGEMDTTAADLPKFLTEFEEVSLPFKMTAAEINKHQYSGEEYDYDPTRDYTKFQYERAQGFEFYPNYDYKYFFKQGPNTAVIYSADTSATASARINRCLYHRLVIYDANGNILDARAIGVHAGIDLSTYEINRDGGISIFNFKRVWRTPYNKYEVGNEVTETIPLDTARMMITPGGKIEIIGE